MFLARKSQLNLQFKSQFSLKPLQYSSLTPKYFSSLTKNSSIFCNSKTWQSASRNFNQNLKQNQTREKRVFALFPLIRLFSTNDGQYGRNANANELTRKDRNSLDKSGEDHILPEKLLVIPVLNRPFFPNIYSLLQLDAGMIEMVNIWKRDFNPYFGLFLKKEDNPSADPSKLTKEDIHHVGVLGILNRVDQSITPANAFFTGLYKIKITEVIESKDRKLVVKVKKLEDEPYDPTDLQIRAYQQEIIQVVRDISSVSQANSWISEQIRFYSSFVDVTNPSILANMTAFILSTQPSLLQPILEETNLIKKQVLVLMLLRNELELFKIQQQINKEVEENVNKTHRKFIMNEQYKVIQKQLGLDKDDRKKIIDKFKERIANKVIPEEPLKIINEELSKLSTIELSSAEFGVTRNYLDWLTILPWKTYKEENLDLGHAQKILDEDHYGLEDIKNRILEFISVGALKKGIQGKILCFVGPPGVGKTSIGKSIARALEREFYRFSVGGIYDVSEIKGHRRTYIGSLPGKIIHGLKSLTSSNPLMLLDEIDKLSHRSHHGDPSAALLELLDPNQNENFLDHYLDVPYDCSKILFVCTANTTETIPHALLDRMEIIEIPGYVKEEKIAIATKYLIPKVQSQTNLSNVTITPEALESIIVNYCREAGVRSLEKTLDKIMRKVAYKVVSGVFNKDHSITISVQELEEYIGKPRYQDVFYVEPPVGVSLGIGYNPMGGSLLPIETISEEGPAGLEITGRMGEVMKESSHIALSYAKIFLDTISPGKNKLKQTKIHMHVPEGATPKDGPSAGTAMVTSLVSLGLNKPIRSRLAMTGEITLTGKILPIGAVKEKTMTARRDGMKHIIFPMSNKKDVDELPDFLKSGLEFHFANTYHDIYAIAFGSSSSTTPSSSSTPSSSTPSSSTPSSPSSTPSSS